MQQAASLSVLIFYDFLFHLVSSLSCFRIVVNNCIYAGFYHALNDLSSRLNHSSRHQKAGNLMT